MDDHERLLRTARVVMLSQRGAYLEPCYDKKSVTLIEPDRHGSEPLTARWSVISVGTGQGLKGRFYLQSIYGKVLGIQVRGKKLVVSQISKGDTEGHGRWNFESKFPIRYLSTPLLKGKFVAPINESHLCGKYDTIHLAQSSAYTTGAEAESRLYLTAASDAETVKLGHGKSLDEQRRNEWVVHIVESATKAHKISQEDFVDEKLLFDYKTTSTSNLVSSHDKTGSGLGRHDLPQPDHSTLTTLKVGLMFFNNYNNATPGPGVGPSGPFSYYNSGQNTNGSGTQKNGDVNVTNEVGTCRDFFVNFH